MARLGNLFNKALTNFHSGEFSSAEAALKKINKIQRGVPEVLHLLELIALETNRPKQAI